MQKSYIINSLNEYLTLYLDLTTNLRISYDENSIHDLRVAIRRLISLLIIIGEIRYSNICSNLIVRLRQQLKEFNRLRDTQVELEEIRLKSLTFPELLLFTPELVATEQKYILKLKTNIANFDIIDIQKNVNLLQNFIQENIHQNENLYEIAYRAAHSAYQKVISRFHQAASNDLDSIHKVRLVFKKFRYIVEVIQPFTRLTKADINKFKYFQTLLGSIQDNTVFTADLKKFIIKLNVDEENFKNYLIYLTETRNRLIEEFFSNNSQLVELWSNELFVMDF